MKTTNVDEHVTAHPISLSLFSCELLYLESWSTIFDDPVFLFSVYLTMM